MFFLLCLALTQPTHITRRFSFFWVFRFFVGLAHYSLYTIHTLYYHTHSHLFNLQEKSLRIVSSNEIKINSRFGNSSSTARSPVAEAVVGMNEQNASTSSVQSFSSSSYVASLSTRSNTTTTSNNPSRSATTSFTNKLFIGPTMVGAVANQMVIRSPDGKLMLVVDDNVVVLTTSKLRVNSEYISIFQWTTSGEEKLHEQSCLNLYTGERARA